VRGGTEAGVGKAWKEETAGEFAPSLVSIDGNLPPDAIAQRLAQLLICKEMWRAVRSGRQP
jgi:hypothetical protein